MQHSSKISVIVITKNRVDNLLHCLGSLAAQSTKPDELIIVDNNSTDQTPLRVNAYAKSVSFPVRLVKEIRHGFPVIYNRGLGEARYSWAAYIDDDCVADVHWVSSIKASIAAHPHAAAIIGHTRPHNPDNIFSLATHIFHTEWKEKNLNGHRIANLEILDNKNIAYNKTFLHIHKLTYDQRRIVHLEGAGEDCDLGTQIQQSGGKAFYNQTISVSHKEPQTCIHYWKKYFLSLAAYEWYKEGWGSKQSPATQKYVHFRTLAFGIAQHYHYTGTRLVGLCIILYMTVATSITLNLLTRIPGMRIRFIRWVERSFTR